MLFSTYDSAIEYAARHEHYAIAIIEQGVYVLVW